MVDIITIVLGFVIGSLLTMVAYTKGLQHNYNLKHDIEPKSTIKEIIEVKKHKEEEKQQASVMNEWLNDPRDDE